MQLFFAFASKVKTLINKANAAAMAFILCMVLPIQIPNRKNCTDSTDAIAAM